MKRIFQKRLFLFVLAAFAATWGITFFLQTKEAEKSARKEIQLRIDDAKAEVVSNANRLLTIKVQNRADAAAKARSFAEILEGKGGSADTAELQRLLHVLNVDELDIIDENGIIVSSSVPKYIGYDMSSNEQSAEFLEILRDPAKEIVQEPRAIGFDSSIETQYAGVAARGTKGLVQIGYSPRRLLQAMEMADISVTAVKFRIGLAGGILLARDGVVIACEPPIYVGRKLSDIDITENEGTSRNFFDAVINGTRQLCISEPYDDMYIIGFLPESEIYAGRQTRMMALTMCLLFIFIAIFILISKLVQEVVIKGINDINASLASITGGDLDALVQVMTNKEFISLSCGINTMVGALKRAIAEAKGRIDAELQVAKAIQHSALPDSGRLARNGADFEIGAEMFTAKEVGGDFYDFFFAEGGRLVFVVADVSGKGIPAALFMMKCKTLINDLAASERSPAKILAEANERLCEGNEMEMFVTVWLGILEISSGRLRFANAGHNPPLLARAEGDFEYLNGSSGLVLGGMEGMKYREFEIRLDKGDAIFLYTDGVTEAIDGKEEAYGEERLKRALDECADRRPEALTEAVKQGLRQFTREEPQFDDVTLLALRMLIRPEKELSVPAVMDSYDRVVGFVEETLSELGCPTRRLMEINIAIDEIFSNIVRYSGASEAAISCGVREGAAFVRISDDGSPYDPLQSKEPDVSLGCDEREIGGLGIFLVKKTMDSVVYEHRGGRNIISIEKKFAGGEKEPAEKDE
ncbi:MAG: SpoIIE family protein phosphatase [Synergistaceae bacterium]|nr:SpoIIE family protein phosphatase [Synergistaceae bacterium]